MLKSAFWTALLLATLCGAGSATSLSIKHPPENAPTVKWYKNGVELLGYNCHSLDFAAATEEDEGDYYAVLTNLAGTITTNVVAFRLDPFRNRPQIVKPLPNTITAHIGESLHVNILANGMSVCE